MTRGAAKQVEMEMGQGELGSRGGVMSTRPTLRIGRVMLDVVSADPTGFDPSPSTLA